VFLKLLIDAVADKEGSAITVAAALLGAAIGVNLAGAWLSFSLRVGMNERVGMMLDSDIAQLAASAEGIEHFERPEYLDRIELLRQEHQNLATVPDTTAWAAALLLRLGGTVIALAAIAPPFALLPLFAVPSLIIGARSQRRHVRAWDGISSVWRQQFEVFQLAATENAGREARVFGTRDHLERRFAGLLESGDRTLGRTIRRTTLEETIGWAIFSAAFVGALGVLTQRVLRREATAGDLVLALTLAAQLNNQIALLAANAGAVVRAFAVGRKLLWLVDYAARANPTTTPAQTPRRLQRGITFDHVDFRYPGTDRPILQELDLLLPAGSTVAVVGENGAGKTTIAKLLTGMYQPTSGQILIDDLPLQSLRLEEWRDHVSASFQDHARFEFPAQHAIGVGDLPHVDDAAAVNAAAERADATDLVDQFPQGLTTQLGRQFDDGMELSGGQWQKVALARGLMRDQPLLLVLDEPTAALDPETESRLFDRYAHAAAGNARTTGGVTVLVSHRFSTVRFADLIVVISGGRVVETGTHAQLIAAGGLYAELYDLQASSYR
jgi:ABC-type multidrug transport system fused ATPase/permease subunit